MVSIRDVARLAGVSHQTVSNAINSPNVVSRKTRERIQAAVDELGYRPNASARRLRSGHSDVIAIGISTADDRAPSPVFDSFLHLLAAQANEANKQIMLYPRLDEETELEHIAELREQSDVDAIVLNELERVDRRPAWLLEAGQPFVLFGRPWNLLQDMANQIPWIDVDGYDGIRKITERLIAEGHTKIGYVGWKSGTGTAFDRESGWRDAVEAAGLMNADNPTEQNTWRVNTIESIDAGTKAAYKLYAAHPDIDAIVCASDNLAVGALSGMSHTMKKRVMDGDTNTGLLSRHIIVTGFDNSSLAQAFSFPSVRQPLETVASELVRMITALVDGEEVTADSKWHTLLKPEVVWRGTPYSEYLKYQNTQNIQNAQKDS